MTALTLILIALGLAMDAFAVSVAYGMSFQYRDHRGAVTLSSAFGGFQAGMPVIGWLCGTGLKHLVEAFDHWVAFALLLVIGGKMIVEALIHAQDHPECSALSTDLKTVLALAVATSIDAMAVGFSLSLLGVRLLGPVLVIGVVTLVVSYAGVVLGYECRTLLGARSRKAVQVAGGLVLVSIGSRILWQHLGLG